MTHNNLSFLVFLCLSGCSSGVDYPEQQFVSSINTIDGFKIPEEGIKLIAHEGLPPPNFEVD